MKLLVPTNWDPSLIAPLSKLEASIELYGVLPTSMIGSGGSGPDNVYMMGGQEEAYIKQAHSAGLKFDYLLNAPSMSNMEWDEKTHGELLEHLEWINSIEADSVTVTIPYLIELIKRQFPHLKTRVSTIAHVDSVARAKSFESLGADSITLDVSSSCWRITSVYTSVPTNITTTIAWDTLANATTHVTAAMWTIV